MRSRLFVFLGVMVVLIFVTGCASTFHVPFSGKSWTHGTLKTRLPREEVRITPDRAPATAFKLEATLEKPDSLLPRFYWESKNPEVLSIGRDDGLAIFRKPGKAQACVRVWYFWRPLENETWEMVRNASNKPTCKEYSTK